MIQTPNNDENYEPEVSGEMNAGGSSESEQQALGQEDELILPADEISQKEAASMIRDAAGQLNDFLADKIRLIRTHGVENVILSSEGFLVDFLSITQSSIFTVLHSSTILLSDSVLSAVDLLRFLELSSELTVDLTNVTNLSGSIDDLLLLSSLLSLFLVSLIYTFY